MLLHAAFLFSSSLVSTNESHFDKRVSFRQTSLVSILEQTSLVSILEQTSLVSILEQTSLVSILEQTSLVSILEQTSLIENRLSSDS